jgi:hypothetical protein
VTDIRLVKTWKLWGMNKTGRGSMTLWLRQPISSIFEHKEPHDDMESRLTVRTTDGQEVTCDDTPENRKALGLIEAGDPPSILIRHEDEEGR